jgi:hypothetical protein
MKFHFIVTSKDLLVEDHMEWCSEVRPDQISVDLLIHEKSRSGVN